MKDAPATPKSVDHGNSRSKLHADHSKAQQLRKQKARDEKNLGYRWVKIKEEIWEEGEVWPLFESCLKGHLGVGNTYRVQRDAEQKIIGLIEQDGSKWTKSLDDWSENMSWYSIAKKLKDREGWTRRKIKDRQKKSKTDKNDRKNTDVARRTDELRPDHSRALMRMCEIGKTEAVKKLVDEFCWRSAAQWEALHRGRLVDHVGGHWDSGQIHRDIWHCGITEHQDSSAPKGVRRDRVPYTIYGIGPGSTCFARHIEVMIEAYGETEPCFLRTQEVVDSNVVDAKVQNGCQPRDLAFNEWLDRWMGEELNKIDSSITADALKEYAEHVREGYRQKKLGVHRVESPSDATLKETAAKYAEQEAKLVERDLKIDDLASKVKDLEAEITGARAELETNRDLTVLGKILVEHMGNHEQNENWTSEDASLAEKGRSFLNWLSGEPSRLMEHFRKLVRPITGEIKYWPPAATLLKFLREGRTK